MTREATPGSFESVYSAKSTPAKTAMRLAPEEIFEQRLLQLIRPGERVLDAGCGAGKFFRADFAAQIPCRRIGLDIQPELRHNEKLHFRAQGDVAHLPFGDGTVDVVICRWVIEHLRQPSLAFAEFSRVLNSSGRLALFTPNLLHYYGAAAKLTPHGFHLWFNRRVRGFDEADISPTTYGANTTRRLRSLLANAGFSRIEISPVEGAPDVLNFNPLFHRAGRIYESVVNRFDWMSPFRMNLIAVASRM